LRDFHIGPRKKEALIKSFSISHTELTSGSPICKVRPFLVHLNSKFEPFASHDKLRGMPGINVNSIDFEGCFVMENGNSVVPVVVVAILLDAVAVVVITNSVEPDTSFSASSAVVVFVVVGNALWLMTMASFI